MQKSIVSMVQISSCVLQWLKWVDSGWCMQCGVLLCSMMLLWVQLSSRLCCRISDSNFGRMMVVKLMLGLNRLVNCFISGFSIICVWVVVKFLCFSRVVLQWLVSVLQIVEMFCWIWLLVMWLVVLLKYGIISVLLCSRCFLKFSGIMMIVYSLCQVRLCLVCGRLLQLIMVIFGVELSSWISLCDMLL